jgi:hypothetical protein
MQALLFVHFAGGDAGPWRVTAQRSLCGEALAPVTRLAVAEGCSETPPGAAWVLRASTGNLRYTTRAERDALLGEQEGLNRPHATRAAFIPIRKNAAWWALAQDERRAILEEQSRHIAIGREYMPAIARRLHHGRELGEPFDFLTWFEFHPDDEPAFDELHVRLRESPEWAFVDREVELRLRRA